MSDATLTTGAPAQVTTTVGQPEPTKSLPDHSFHLGDVGWALIAAAALTAILTFFRTRDAAKRKEDQDNAASRTQAIMDAIKLSHDDSARDVRELTDKVKDGRTMLEKDIEAIRSVSRHDKANADQNWKATAELIGKTNADIASLRDRMTTQEEKSRNHDNMMSEIKTLIKEKNEETKQLIKSQGEHSDAQFIQLANTIREMSTRSIN